MSPIDAPTPAHSWRARYIVKAATGALSLEDLEAVVPGLKPEDLTPIHQAWRDRRPATAWQLAYELADRVITTRPLHNRR